MKATFLGNIIQPTFPHFDSHLSHYYASQKVELARWVQMLYYVYSNIGKHDNFTYEDPQSTAHLFTLGKSVNDLLRFILRETYNIDANKASLPATHFQPPIPAWVRAVPSKSSGIPDWVLYYGQVMKAMVEWKRKGVLTNGAMAEVVEHSKTGIEEAKGFKVWIEGSLDDRPYYKVTNTNNIPIDINANAISGITQVKSYRNIRSLANILL
jgi:hypothetical protein